MHCTKQENGFIVPHPTGYKNICFSGIVQGIVQMKVAIKWVIMQKAAKTLFNECFYGFELSPLLVKCL